VIDLALYAHEDWFGVASIDLAAHEAGETAGDFLSRWAGRIGAVPDGLAQTVGVDPAALVQDFPEDDRKGAAAAAIALAALSPQFLLR
jgi:hypothetical protein